ncbi:MAG: DUF4837 family protein [Gemmatimonadota bacterium]
MTLLAAGCGRPAAMGKFDSLILVIPDVLWEQVAEMTEAALEPTIFTTRDDRKFVVTQVDPLAPDIVNLLTWKQVIVMAPPGDPNLEKIASGADRDELASPDIFRSFDVWARNQVATGVVLDPAREVASLLEQLPALGELVDADYRAYVHGKMFVSGVDTALAQALEANVGVTAMVPKVYTLTLRSDDIAVIRNDNPDPSELIRSILVQRIAGPGAGQVPSAADSVYAWRESIDDVQYNVPQSITPLEGSDELMAVGDAFTAQVRGTWKDEGSFPAAGPFIARSMQCGDYTIFVDAWLYSPSPRRSKYEYMLQLEEILDSFRCTN